MAAREQLNIRIPKAETDRAKRAAGKKGFSITALIRYLLAKYCDKVLGK